MSAASRCILAIDQSTSATKAVAYDTQGRMLDRAVIEHRGIYPRPGLVEHDAEELWQNTQSVLRGVTDRGLRAEFLAITNQRETFVIFDRQTGRPLHNAIVWQCRRGDEVCAELRRAGHEDLVSQRTGLRIDSYFSAPKLAALLRANPELRTRLMDGSALVSTIDAYLIHRLTGGRVFATDPTNACRTLLYDINTLNWDVQLCELFGVPMQALPELRDSTASFGQCVSTGLPICGVMGDSQAALFAQRCHNPGEAKVTLGTGSSILLNVGHDLPSAGVRTLGWVHEGKPTYCLEGIISYSAATITWLRDQLGLIESFEQTESDAQAVQDNAGVYLVPAFAGLSAPHWVPDARGAIVGLSAGSKRTHVVRAALESIAYQIRDALESMRAQSGVEPRAIRADGGASRNRFLTQFIADILGVKLAVPAISECSSLGAALAGALGMGMFHSLDELVQLPSTETVFEPKMSRQAADDLHAGWTRAVGQVLAGATPRAMARPTQ